jgi:MFS family permease
LCSGAQNLAMFLGGRVVSGLGGGIMGCSVPIYQAEVSTPETRGFMVCLRLTVCRRLTSRQVCLTGVAFAWGYTLAGWLGYVRSEGQGSARLIVLAQACVYYTSTVSFAGRLTGAPDIPGRRTRTARRLLGDFLWPFKFSFPSSCSPATEYCHTRLGGLSPRVAMMKPSPPCSASIARRAIPTTFWPRRNGTSSRNSSLLTLRSTSGPSSWSEVRKAFQG